MIHEKEKGSTVTGHEIYTRPTAASSVRLYVIHARDAAKAVIFRRGPSRQVQLIKWHTDTDQFYQGQWFAGRIYERRCDLSPDGELLIYFAAKYKEPYYSWTAISKPPYLTALALWPKGDGWGGGGLFESKKSILLNHREGEMELAEGFDLPTGLYVRPYGDRPGWGEDRPILGERLLREGWVLSQAPSYQEQKYGSELWIRMDPPEIWELVNRRSPNCVLRMVVTGLQQRGGPWYMIEHEIANKDSGEMIPVGESSWAGWAPNGDLLFAKGGKIFRLSPQNDSFPIVDEAIQLIDLLDNRFEAIEAPATARDW